MTPSIRPRSRRAFLARTALVAGALGIGRTRSATAEATDATRFPLIGFSKPSQKPDPAETAELVEAVGWDGIELPVRAKGQVEPERAPDELPRFAEALRRPIRGRASVGCAFGDPVVGPAAHRVLFRHQACDG